MSDNTQVVSGSGDEIRTLDKGREDLAKTQLIALDVGGEYRESIFTEAEAKVTNELLIQILDELKQLSLILRGTL